MPTIAEQWRQEGIEKGEARGVLIGRICAIEEFLGRKVSLPKILQGHSVDELERLLDQLSKELKDRQ